jgi:hypothetical protein
MSNTISTGLIDLNFSRDLPEEELLTKEKETLRLQASRFVTSSIQEYYTSIVSAFKREQSLRPFFLNTQMVGIDETSRFFYLSSSALCDYIQSSYSDDLSISQLNILNESSAAFFISGFTKKSTFLGMPIKTVIINIKRIVNADFIPLKGKTVIDFIVFSPYSAEDFAKNSWGDADDYYSTLTSFPMYERISPFLQMILDDKRFFVRPGDNYIIER